MSATESTGESVTTERAYVGDDLYDLNYPVPTEYRYSMLASEADRWAVLASIGVARPEDDPEATPLTAWRDAVADASGVSRASLDPAKGGRLDLGFSPAYVRKFVWFLA